MTEQTKSFIRVCRFDEIEEGKTKVIMFEGREILLARQNGKVYALENICSHDGGILGEGAVVDGQVECPRHGARFDIETGQAMRMPAVAEIESFEVRIADGDVLVSPN
ncbi:MAG: non-heme iron oxygenase ferredoxin subunit [Candidatus Zixiibacteriota bacterium]|nr:MAG: non-heme iron oxygenase ferredoxin subunit [candidate division Zixibacteria bacterium]